MKLFETNDMTVYLKWEPRDLWVGLYWDRRIVDNGGPIRLHVLSLYFCLLPCLPLLVELRRYKKARPWP